MSDPEHVFTRALVQLTLHHVDDATFAQLTDAIARQLDKDFQGHPLTLQVQRLREAVAVHARTWKP